MSKSQYRTLPTAEKGEQTYLNDTQQRIINRITKGCKAAATFYDENREYTDAVIRTEYVLTVEIGKALIIPYAVSFEANPRHAINRLNLTNPEDLKLLQQSWERRRIDIIAFSSSDRTQPVAFIEVKRKANSLDLGVQVAIQRVSGIVGKLTEEWFKNGIGASVFPVYAKCLKPSANGKISEKRGDLVVQSEEYLKSKMSQILDAMREKLPDIQTNENDLKLSFHKLHEIVRPYCIDNSVCINDSGLIITDESYALAFCAVVITHDDQP